MTEVIKNKFKQVRSDQIDRYEARRIRTKVRDARNSVEDAGVRWPFELLQNALDAGPRPDRCMVSLRIAAFADSVVFEHDGAPFSLEELAALLSGGSSKDFESEQQTGRFGTGFLVTHVLAVKTRILGLIANDSSFEEFNLVLDRGGNEDSILENIRQCEEDLEAAKAVSDVSNRPSARFEYVVEDPTTLELGIRAFLAALPFLYATRQELGSVEVTLADGEMSVWKPRESSTHAIESGIYIERDVSVEKSDGTVIDEYRTVRFQREKGTRAGAIILLKKDGDTWKCCIPAADFPRLFRDYPIRTSGFIPVNFVLDGKFEVTQERDRVSMTQDDMQLIKEALDAAVLGLEVANREKWKNCHLLAHLARTVGSFAKTEHEEKWWNVTIGGIAHAFAKLPVVETRRGSGPAISTGDSWFADFPVPRLLPQSTNDETTLDRLWSLVDEADDLFPPKQELAHDWTEIALGWRDLGVPVNLISLQSLATQVRGKSTELSGLQVRTDRYQWLASFIDVVGECWANRNGIETSVFHELLPNQCGRLLSPNALFRDEELTDELKDISTSLGINIRERLFDRRITSVHVSEPLSYLGSTIHKAIPNERTESNLISELLEHLEEVLQDGLRLGNEEEPLVQGSIRLLQYLWTTKGSSAAPLARKMPLLTTEGKIVRWSSDKLLMAPVSHWHQDAQPFEDAYPEQRVLKSCYCGDVVANVPNVVDHLISWGIAIGDPLGEETASELKDKGLASIARAPADVEGATLHGERFSQIALLRSGIFNRVEVNEEAARALLGLVLCHIAPHDPRWRRYKSVTAKRAGEPIACEVRDALWISDLRSRLWVPRTDSAGEKSIAPAEALTLLPLLDPNWLDGNDAAIELLTECFGFDALEMRLLGAEPDDAMRQRLRNGLARLVETAGSDPAIYDTLRAELLEKGRRERDVNRFRRVGFAIQDAIQESLAKRSLHIEVIDRGFDLAVGDIEPEDLDERAIWLAVGAELVEIKATTTGHPRMTSTQASKAAAEYDRYSLCVVDLRNVSDERLDQAWTAEDVDPLAKMVTDIGVQIKDTVRLVNQACGNSISIRNERALRYEVPPTIWESGVSIDAWIETVFAKGEASAAEAEITQA